MKFDLKKAMANGGKCVINRDGKISSGIIVCDEFKVDGKNMLLIVEKIISRNSNTLLFTNDGVGFDSRYSLENVPESRNIFTVVTAKGVFSFLSYELLLDFARFEEVISTSKRTVLDGEFLESKSN